MCSILDQYISSNFTSVYPSMTQTHSHVFTNQVMISDLAILKSNVKNVQIKSRTEYEHQVRFITTFEIGPKQIPKNNSLHYPYRPKTQVHTAGKISQASFSLWPKSSWHPHLLSVVYFWKSVSHADTTAPGKWKLPSCCFGRSNSSS